jgi:hypothetical protein
MNVKFRVIGRTLHVDAEGSMIVRIFCDRYGPGPIVGVDTNGVRICRIVDSHVDAGVVEVEGTILWVG